MFYKPATVFLAIAFCIGFFDGSAQPKDSLLSQLVRKWEHAKAYTLKIAELMPEKDYNFKPVPEEMSFRQQLLHIAQNMDWLSSSYLAGGKQKKTDTTGLSKEAILKLVSAAYDSALAVHYRLTTEQLDEVVPFFAGPLSRRQILILMHDHQTHHVGQLIVYLRLMGIKPPGYVGW